MAYFIEYRGPDRDWFTMEGETHYSIAGVADEVEETINACPAIITDVRITEVKNGLAKDRTDAVADIITRRSPQIAAIVGWEELV